jgi:hypothetical protein
LDRNCVLQRSIDSYKMTFSAKRKQHSTSKPFTKKQKTNDKKPKVIDTPPVTEEESDNFDGFTSEDDDELENEPQSIVVEQGMHVTRL